MKSIVLISTATLLFFSCNKEPGEIQEEPSCNITYSNTIKQIIDNYCINCHGGTFEPDLSTFTAVNALKDRIKIRVVDNQTMPPNGISPLSQSEFEAISCWAEAGGPP